MLVSDEYAITPNWEPNDNKMYNEFVISKLSNIFSDVADREWCK